MFHYVACGLPNVWLENGYTITNTPQGEMFSIVDVKELHKAIGFDLCNKSGLVTGDEFRFLRSEIGLSRRSLGELLDVSPETIKKWESGENPIAKMADMTLRALFTEYHKQSSDISALVNSINVMEREVRKLCFTETERGWIQKCA